MRCAITERPSPPQGFELVDHGGCPQDILAIYEAWGRDITWDKIRRRFARGSRFYALRRDGVNVATTWIVVSGERFVDEIAMGFPLSSRMLWWRDVYVPPETRGQGIFSVLVEAVLATGLPDKWDMWSDVSAYNHASLRAHSKCGFTFVREYDVLHVMKRIVLRLRWPSERPAGSAYQPQRRVIWTGPLYRQFIAERVA